MKLPAIRKSMLGFACKEHLVVVDTAWTGRPIDAQVGDLIRLPAGTRIEGAVVEALAGTVDCVVQASRPGIGRAVIPGSAWAEFVRVSRKQYTGLARYRHLEEVEDE
jgi:hypothetical protein